MGALYSTVGASPTHKPGYLVGQLFPRTLHGGAEVGTLRISPRIPSVTSKLLEKVTEGLTGPFHSCPYLPKKSQRQAWKCSSKAPTCQLRDVGHAEPVGIVTTATQDFTDLALAEEQLNHHSIKVVSQPERQKRGRGT